MQIVRRFPKNLIRILFVETMLRSIFAQLFGNGFSYCLEKSMLDALYLHNSWQILAKLRK